MLTIGKRKTKVEQEKKELPEVLPVATEEVSPDLLKNASEIAKEQIESIGGTTSTVNFGELLDKIVKDALQEKASDIHIEPGEHEVIVRYRVDGMLREVLKLEKELEQALVFKVKINSKLRTDEHFAPQDGRIRFTFDGKNIDTRISILPTTKGEKIVIRLLTSEGNAYDLENLGIVDRELAVIKKSYQKPYGMILAVGPTGSGKTTTLYSILKILNSREVNITTVEDPVEYDIPGINHVQINNKADLTFANGLRAILRQDPNIVMIGEIRDNETARIAINAAMTGHLVLSTLHTNDSVTTVPRLVDMGVEPFLLASTLNVIIAQRLARKLCEKCKEKYNLMQKNIDEVKELRPDISELLVDGAAIYKEKGCDVCNKTGFKGRIGLYEVLEIKESIRRIIIEKSSNADDIFESARKDGLSLIVEDGVKKLKQGIISISELIRVTAIKE